LCGVEMKGLSRASRREISQWPAERAQCRELCADSMIKDFPLGVFVSTK
jgi:hypothetical protein